MYIIVYTSMRGELVIVGAFDTEEKALDAIETIYKENNDIFLSGERKKGLKGYYSEFEFEIFIEKLNINENALLKY